MSSQPPHHHTASANTPTSSSTTAASSAPASTALAPEPVASTAPMSESSPLAMLERSFTALVTGPTPLSLDLRTVPGAAAVGLPARVMGMGEVRSLLLHPSTSYDARDAIWTAVINRARAHAGATTPSPSPGPAPAHRRADPGEARDAPAGSGLGGDPAWVVASVALTLPGLRRMAGRLARRVSIDEVADLESEMLTGYLTALRTIDTTTGRIASRLCWAAYRAADRHRVSDPAASGVVAGLGSSTPPPRPFGHPDFVLARVVADGVLSEYEAELIARTRLEGTTLKALAFEWALPHSTLSDDRARAETRLVAVLDPHATHQRKVTERSRSRTGPDSDPRNQGLEDAGQARTTALTTIGSAIPTIAGTGDPAAGPSTQGGADGEATSDRNAA
jgi:hypothetical protein